MAKSTKTETPRSESITVVNDTENKRANAVLAAWQGLYHLFGARATFSYTDDGLTVENFSVSEGYDPNQIVEDISHRTRRLDFEDVYPWFNGEAPEPFSDAKEMTAWSVQFLRGAVEENSSRTPKYVRDAFAAYKTENNFAKRRGPKKKIFRVDNIASIDTESLKDVNPADLAKLQETLNAAIAAAAANTGGDTSAAASEIAEAVQTA